MPQSNGRVESMTQLFSNSDESHLHQQVLTGDRAALGKLLDAYRDRLTRTVSFRMDPGLRGRIDPEDVLQDAYVEATERFDAWLQSPTMPLLVWLRFIVLQRLMQLHRFHLAVQARSARREVSIDYNPVPEATSAVLAAQLLGDRTSPSQALMRKESSQRLEQALEALEPLDREVLALRHFEHLSNTEVAAVLQISPTAASNRYIRALRRLKQVAEVLHLGDFM